MKNFNKFTRIIAVIMAIALMSVLFCGCEPSSSRVDTQKTLEIGNKLSENQPTPTDIEYSLARYNLIRRLYYVNGQVEKAKNLPCEVQKPLGYIYLFVEGVGCVLCDTVDGMVSPMQSYLTPDSEYYDYGGSAYNKWLPDVDGTYGENCEGIFYFDAQGGYHEWTGRYYYSETYYPIDDPIINIVVEQGNTN